ncbi:uncharacterized protein LOC113359716 [Papaver somniferum]|uniref:uncharacterized protein LOC113359716 n=1 Tax=Papaver somniferum TaxID=3469 RepID=UPI000E6F49B2|nr:uncharacterized protein LOC113359716 [Papaver somniferum]
MSWVWASICHGLDILKHHAIWDIRDGNSAHAFTDNWIINPSYPRCVNYPNPNYKVSDFIIAETKSWNVPLVQDFFTNDNSQKICSMRVPLSGSDCLVCPYNKNGVLTVKSIYKLLASELPHNSIPIPDFYMYRALWRSPLLPRTHLFLWKCVENILPTGNMLVRYNNQHDDRCKMCNLGVSESPEHMLLHCSFAKDVWQHIPVVNSLVLQDSGTQISIKDWVTKWLISSHLQDHLVRTMNTAWCIWKARCSKVFEDKTSNPRMVARTAMSIAAETVNTLTTVPPCTILRNAAVVEPNDLILHPNCITIFCDGSFDKDTNKAGIGIVAMHSTDGFRGCKLISWRCISPEETECYALLEDAHWIRDQGFQNICLVSDAKNVMAYLNNYRDQISWSSCSVLDDCLFLLQDTQIICFKYVKRNLNILADIAARHSRVDNVSGEWHENNCPHFLQNVVNSI